MNQNIITIHSLLHGVKHKLPKYLFDIDGKVVSVNEIRRGDWLYIKSHFPCNMCVVTFFYIKNFISKFEYEVNHFTVHIQQDDIDNHIKNLTTFLQMGVSPEDYVDFVSL